jgi:RNA polymerase sigma factor (sigma-70 family)
MGDDASQQNEASHSKSGAPIKRVRQDQARSAADSTARPPHATGRGDAEIYARYCDRTPLTDDQRALAVRFMPMAQALARRAIRLGPPEDEELQSAAYMALVEAASTFDPSRKVKFATYVRHRIRGALRDYRRLVLADGWRGDPAHRPVFEKLRGNIEEYGRVLGVEPASPVGAEMESTEAVEKWLRRLPRAQAAACRLIYLHGKSQDEAAALVGCSKSYMSRLHREAIARLIQDYHAATGPRDPASPDDES